MIYAIEPGNFRVKGDTLDIIPAYSEDIVRISLFGDEVEKITLLDHVISKRKEKGITNQNLSCKTLSYCKRC